MRKYLRSRVLMLLFVVGGLVGGTAFITSGPTTLSESEAAEVDAQSYADDFGVSLEVAKDRLAQQVKIGEAIADLRDAEASTFAGAWVEHTPEWRVVVRTTASGPSTKVLESYFSDTGVSLTVKRDAPWSEQQTLVNVQAIEDALEGAVDEHLVFANPREPKGVVVSVRIPSDMLAATPEQLAQRLPDVVTEKSASVMWIDGPLIQKQDVYGGAQLWGEDPDDGDEFGCTSGFAVEDSDGNTGLVTAGHCEEIVTYEAPDGTEYDATWEDGVDGTVGDFGWFTTGETEDNRIYQSNTVRRTITSYEDDFDTLHVGKYICKYGRVSGYGCDKIHSLAVWYNHVIMEKESTKLGDSGGPWFHANRAYGVYEGVVEYGDGTRRSVWSAVAFLEDALDVTVLTD